MTGKTRNLAAVAASMLFGLVLAAGAPRAAPQPEGQPGGSSATSQATDPATNPWTSAQPPKASGGKGGTRREAQAEAMEAAAAQAATKQADPQAQKHRAKRAAKKAAQAPSSASAMTRPADEAFGTIAEVVRKLEDDPNTDWSKVDLEALRQHLIDMNEITLNATAVAKPIEGGLKITVTGTGRTAAAIQRMVPAHAKEIDGLNGWAVKAQLIPRGALLQVTSNDADQVKHIRGLGFIGIMVTGGHHAEHHLVMAKGGAAHKH